VARAEPLVEAEWFLEWGRAGLAGEMKYLTGRRAVLRSDPRTLLASARSVICVGKLYNPGNPDPAALRDPERACVSRYAWGEDYHAVMRAGLLRLKNRLASECSRGLEARIAVDTAPLLERALARRAGLGWIGRNTCLINQRYGSWFFLGELLVSWDIEPDAPPPERCGNCMRCVQACPTRAIIPTGRSQPAWTVDARRCLAYLTIELRAAVPENLRAAVGRRVFGCDICQEVCPWNRRAPLTDEPAFAPRFASPRLAELAELSECDFRRRFARSAVRRAGWRGLLRNVAVALGNSGWAAHRSVLEKLISMADPLVSEHARWAWERLGVRSQ